MAWSTIGNISTQRPTFFSLKSTVKVHASQAYRTMYMPRKRISLTFDSRECSYISLYWLQLCQSCSCLCKALEKLYFCIISTFFSPYVSYSPLAELLRLYTFSIQYYKCFWKVMYSVYNIFLSLLWVNKLLLISARIKHINNAVYIRNNVTDLPWHFLNLSCSGSIML